ncbi:type VI secretion system contractile sheath large subunit [Paraneptunicella aestuarii]|uniref:type VI secretion system contractile sheath large subunit n=1 Tax=Paraneptunicella aestuarii TaxID=2831148 RepID=UPI001E4DC115|nr:type VI secretion system contractile sheath large subunit [Paraneptunicella aestuarii]UAA40641.1 type VI secretion system contractile sheath large subunit [Paraneptunicella aestuarii]
MSNSIQHKLSRVRPPRVQITYDVETGGAIEKKELPFIVGIIAPLSAKSDKKMPPLRDRKMVQIDRDNFNKVMESIEPRLKYSVPNTLPGEKEPMQVNVAFHHIDDFDPVAVVNRVPKLKALYDERSRLRDFLAKLDGNDGLNNILVNILKDKDKLDAIKAVIDGAKETLAANREKLAKSELDQKAYDDATLELFKDELADGKDINSMLTDGQLILDQPQKPYALELIAEYVTQILANDDLIPKAEGKDAPDYNIGGMITTRIAQKDKVISRQLNHIIHHDEFQALEGSWRGLHFLVMNTETSTKLKLKLLNVSYDDLYKDLDKAVEFDQSALFKIVYEEEYGTFGGEPYSVLIGDYQLGRTARDIKFLEMISGVAAAAHAPFIASAYAKLFDLEDYANLYKPRDLSKIFESAELIKWRSFRETEDSRYVTLTLPRVMLRLPYHHENNPVEGIYFDEDVAVNLYKTDDDGNLVLEGGKPVWVLDKDDDGIEFEKTIKQVDARKILWGNPAYILGQRITNAFSLHGWTAAIRGVEGGGLVEGLPAYTFETENGDIDLTCPTEVSITDRREKELNDLGFMAICHCKGTDKAAFFGGQSTNKPKQYLTDSATANARISSMLPYVMSASRFAHYIKVLMREKIGSFMTRQNVEAYLNTWIAQYVLLDDTPPQHIKAKYPLREARINVTDVPGKPGAYRATVFLKPHFQLEELSTSIRLVADLPS